jgi:hypothetical protein
MKTTNTFKYILALLIFVNFVNAQVSPEYQENKFQGAEEVPIGFVLKESDLIGGAWQSPSGDKYGYYTNQKHLLQKTNGNIIEMLWDVKDNYIRIFDPKDNKKFVTSVHIVSKGYNTISVMKDDGTIYDMERVAEIKTGKDKKAVNPVVKKTIPKRKVNSPLPITEKNIVGKWQGDNGTIYNFFYNKYVQMTPRNQKSIDCHWWLDNGYIAMEAWGDIIIKPQVISISKTKMTLAVDTGDLHLTKLSSPTR